MKVDVLKNYTFVLTRKSSNGVMPKNKYPVSVTIPGEDTILDIPVGADGKPLTDQAEPRKIRYSKGEKSIFVDEQSDSAKATPITIDNGIKVVSGRDQVLVKFLMAANYCKNSTQPVKYHHNVWYKYMQPEEEANELVEKQRKKINLKAKIMNMPFNDLKNFALAIDQDPKKVKNIYKWDMAQLQHYLLRLADSNQSLFDIDFKSDVIYNKVVLLRGVQEGILEMNTLSRTLKWANTGSLIVQSALGESPVDYVAVNSLNNPDYATIIKEIAQKLNVQNLFSPVFLSEAEDAKPKEVYADNVSIHKVAINEGLEAGVIEKKGGLYYFGTVKGKLETLENKLKTDSALLIKLISATQEASEK